MIEINRETMREELLQRLISIFSLPETRFAVIKRLYIPKASDREALKDLAAQAVERCYHDFVSDIDIHVHVVLSPQSPFSREEYLRRIDRFGFREQECLGVIFAKETDTWRIILKNGMRYDFIFELTFDSQAEVFSLPPLSDEPRLPEVPLWPAENISRFWFESSYALTRLYRDHYLQADQQANVLLNETLTLQNTPLCRHGAIPFRRHGSREVPAYTLVDPDSCPFRSDTPGFSMIAGKVYAATVTFDRLITQRTPSYPERRQDLFAIWNFYHSTLYR